MKTRCDWANDNQLMIDYHDNEWGVPLYDDKKLLEFLILDGFQAGLSWLTILKKRKNFQEAFDNFDVEKIAEYSDKKILELLQNKGIIRNKMKINATIKNAKAYIKLLDSKNSFSDYLWQFVGGKPVVGHYKVWQDIPTTSKESEAMSKDLKKIGFSFVGPTICYAFMQAAGLINDHTISCFRRDEIINISK